MSESAIRSVFYSDNATTNSAELGAAVRAIKSRTLTPALYVNVRRAARSSNTDHQIRNGFYGALVICLYFRENGSAWFPVLDHWAIDELGHIRCPGLIYLAPNVSAATQSMLASKASGTCRIRRLSASDDLQLVLAADLIAAGL